MPVHFEESQSFSPWAHAALGLVAFITLITSAACLSATGQLDAGFPIVVLTVLPLFLLMNLFFMTTQVEAGMVTVRFGYFAAFYRKRIPLDGLTEARPVTYKPIAQAGGWGIRWGRFDGAPCRFFNARGNQGVLMVIDGKQIIIGSQVPEALAASFRQHGSAPPS